MEKLLNKFIELNEKLDDPALTVEARALIQSELNNCKQNMANTGVFTFDNFYSKASW